MNGTEPEFNPSMETHERLQPFDVHESSERAGLIKLLIGFGILLALAFIVMKLYQPGTRARTDPPLITAENTPFKIVPEDVEGTQTPDQDKEVFEVMTGSAPSTDVVTLPAPEVPIRMPDTSQTDTQSREPVQSEPQATTEAPRQRPVPQQTQPVTAPVPPPVSAPSTVTPPLSTGGSDWVVQVASLRSQAEAERTYSTIQNKYASILSGYGVDIRRVDLAEKGIYFRARIDGFSNRDAAASTCDRLKAAGQACFVTRR